MKNYYVYKAVDGRIVLVDDVNLFVKKVYDPDLHKYAGVMLSVIEGKNFEETVERACKLYENPTSVDGEVFVADEPKLVISAREKFEKEMNSDADQAYFFLEQTKKAMKSVAKQQAKKMNKSPKEIFNLIKSIYIVQLQNMNYEDEV